VPKNPNNPGYDWLLFFELTTVPKPSKAPKGKINKNILVVAIENKFTLLGNSTVINYKDDIANKRKNTLKELLPVIQEENVVFVVMARRRYTSSTKLPRNTFVLSQDEYHKLVGPTMLYLLKTVESMDSRSTTTIVSPAPSKLLTGKRSRESDGEDDHPQKKKQKTRPYECPHCKRGYKSKSWFDKHVKTHL